MDEWVGLKGCTSQVHEQNSNTSYRKTSSWLSRQTTSKCWFCPICSRSGMDNIHILHCSEHNMSYPLGTWRFHQDRWGWEQGFLEQPLQLQGGGRVREQRVGQQLKQKPDHTSWSERCMCSRVDSRLHDHCSIQPTKDGRKWILNMYANTHIVARTIIILKQNKNKICVFSNSIQKWVGLNTLYSFI